MDQFLTFFEDMPSWQKLGWIVVCMSLNFIIEGVRPMFTGGYRSWKHTRTNLVFLSTTMVINVVFGLLTVGVFAWGAEAQVGLLHWFEAPTWVELLAAVVVFDFIAQFGVHWCLHNVPLLWNLHMVHHSDTHVDVTTGTRHHPVDFIVREGFAVVAVVVTGAPIAFYVFYRILTVFFTYMTHANIDLPDGLERVLGWVFVTPRMHKFHHHFEAPWTDRNYGNMLSIWDRLFGTMVDGDVAQIKYGLDVADDSRGDDLAYQMSLPFRTKERK
ncbi:MAG: sterol desaturase [Crocinitomicaceae bacterium]|nr:sterol desaturase [Crocinitomicaceae bacterium]